jgi:hypothetical protein
MPQKIGNPKTCEVTYKDLQNATGLGIVAYAQLMGVSVGAAYKRGQLGKIKKDTYTELALLHADAHPFFKLVLRETGEI